MINIREISSVTIFTKVAKITLNDLITFVTGHGYVPGMEITVNYSTVYEYNRPDDQEEIIRYGEIDYTYQTLKGTMDIETVLENYVVRYAQGSKVFTISHIDYENEVFSVEYTTQKRNY